ncbi:hypothetical protein [Mycoplasma phocimorsus]|uniref:hypothetical protein n=1 Tax=Mycoplasma phocimorsus TaxID=3045839 RepID=UPI0024BF5A3F|nr:hypothetical protein [Mycoplasma phocimorsus]MDJ1647297.1 hypothetical protein [Mycoplasma phocimorsus]
MNVKNIIRWISTTVGITSSFLISTSVSNSHIYEIQYVNTDNIDVNNLTRKYNSNVETKLIKAKAKNGFIFSGWKLKDETIIDTIAVGTEENIILSPVLINEYPNYSSIKNLFIDSSSKINFDIRVIKIKQLITKEELAFGNEKYQLQKLIVEAINNFDNKLMCDIILDSHFASGSHASNNVNTIRSKTSVSISNSETTSVWRLVWAEVKSWWNNWLGTAFYGLIGVSATIGISYSAYTSYWKNKRNFMLKEGENLKITLQLFLKEGISENNWYGRFYNEDSEIYTDCSCQRKFKKENDKFNNNNNKILSVSYILTNGPTRPKLLLYNNEIESEYFSIIDYYPGYNIIPFYKYNSKKEKIGDLFIKREKITDQILCEMYTKSENYIECKHNSLCCKIEEMTNKCHIAIEKKKCRICENKQNKSKCECKAFCCKNCDEIKNCKNITFNCMCKKEKTKK